MFEREWKFYLDDMILFSEKVLAIRKDLTGKVLKQTKKHTMQH